MVDFDVIIAMNRLAHAMSMLIIVLKLSDFIFRVSQSWNGRAVCNVKL